MLPIYLQRDSNNFNLFEQSGKYITSINDEIEGIEYNARQINNNPIKLSIKKIGGKKLTKKQRKKQKTKRKRSRKKTKRKQFTKVCKCDMNKKIQIKNKLSPEGYGMCSHCSPINIIMKGKNGNMWKNIRKNNRNKWIEIII